MNKAQKILDLIAAEQLTREELAQLTLLVGTHAGLSKPQTDYVAKMLRMAQQGETT